MTGIVFLNMGGPDCPDAVRPFLYNLFSDRSIIRLGPAMLQRPIAWFIASRRAPKSTRAYLKIGGKSPLADITMAQAKAVEHALKKQGAKPVLCEPAMRYWRPRTPDVLAGFRKQGITRCLAVSMYPHYCDATSGSSIREFKACAVDLHMKFQAIDSFADYPGYITALAEVVTEALQYLGLGRDGHRRPLRLPGDTRLVYSAHSVPRALIDRGDPYVKQLNRTVKALEAITGIQGSLCYQSRSGPVEWLTPPTDEYLKDLADQGVKNIIVLPISFVSDHIETLYELDILYGDMMRERGVRLVRTPSLNTRPGFIKALTDLAFEGIRELEASD